MFFFRPQPPMVRLTLGLDPARCPPRAPTRPRHAPTLPGHAPARPPPARTPRTAWPTRTPPTPSRACSPRGQFPGSSSCRTPSSLSPGSRSTGLCPLAPTPSSPRASRPPGRAPLWVTDTRCLPLLRATPGPHLPRDGRGHLTSPEAMRATRPRPDSLWMEVTTSCPRSPSPRPRCPSTAQNSERVWPRDSARRDTASRRSGRRGSRRRTATRAFPPQPARRDLSRPAPAWPTLTRCRPARPCLTPGNEAANVWETKRLSSV